MKTKNVLLRLLPSVVMRKATSEQSKQFKLEKMKPLENIETESSKKLRAKGRSSIKAIPAPDPKIIYKKKEIKKKEPEIVDETLSDVLCNSYKFVVNYGVFESNFEWLPCEVKTLKETDWK